MKELERFKSEISLVEYAPTHDYTELDRSQSSKTCVVLRRQSDDGKIAVSRGLDGHWVYYDFRLGKGGSILDFVMQHTGCNLGETRKELRKSLYCNTNSFSHTARKFNTAAFRGLEPPNFRFRTDQTVCRVKKGLDQPKMIHPVKKRKHRSPGKRISVFSGQIYVGYSRATRVE